MSKSKSGKSGFALMAEEELLQEEALGMGLAFQLEDDQGSEDEVGVPQDGMQYLKQVVKEAKKLDAVFKAANVPKPAPALNHYVDRAIIPVPDKYRPSRSWVDKQVRDFSLVREKLDRFRAKLASDKVQLKAQLPGKTNERGWAVYCYGADFWNKLVERRKEIQTEEESAEEDDEEEEEDPKLAALVVTDDNKNGHPPKTNDILYLKHHACVAILEFQVSWAESFGTISDAMGKWIYSLLTRIEKPLEPDVSSAIRSFCIVCSRQRAELIKEEKDMSLVTALTLLICLGTKYFGQEDLADCAK